VAGRLTLWQDLGRFWFTKRLGTDLLVLEARNLAGRMEMVIDQAMKEQISNELKKKLAHEEVSPSSLDKMTDWFSKRLPQ
jgi:hypothetical protein